jgi:hypothetical protein
VLPLGAATKFINAEETAFPFCRLKSALLGKWPPTNGALLVTALPAILGK